MTECTCDAATPGVIGRATSELLDDTDHTYFDEEMLKIERWGRTIFARPRNEQRVNKAFPR